MSKRLVQLENQSSIDYCDRKEERKRKEGRRKLGKVQRKIPCSKRSNCTQNLCSFAVRNKTGKQ